MEYSTRSKKRILEFFSSSPQSSFTLSAIILHCDDIPKSSVYRIVDCLEKDGELRVVGVSDKRERLYQISNRMSCPNHMHIRCTLCGKTVHIDETTSNEIEALLETRLGYSDCFSTVFKGKCSECRRKEK